MERAPSRSDVSGMLQQTPLLCIPPECLLYVSCFLEEGMDVEALEQTCKGCLKVLRSSKAWQHRISSEFGLDLAASGRVPDGCSALGAPSVVSQLKQVYKQLKAQKAPTDVRFRGCFTDGGCDGGQMRYWVDNMFVPNHWESHCTDAGSDVACIGVLLEIDEPAAQEAAQHRQYLIERCRIASDRLFEMPIDLNTWTTAELEHFFQELYTELQQRNAVGALLIHGVPDPRTRARHAEARAAAALAQQHRRIPRAGRWPEGLPAEDARRAHRAAGVGPLPMQPSRRPRARLHQPCGALLVPRVLRCGRRRRLPRKR
uniref:F-box domain-containing protein n=1 Tax=Tetraselmis sp. GSL018 TaxID=582737 RepID=A0A061QTT1_9CHLO